MPVDIPSPMHGSGWFAQVVVGVALLGGYLAVLVALQRLGLPEGALALVAVVGLVAVAVGALPLFRRLFAEN